MKKINIFTSIVMLVFLFSMSILINSSCKYQECYTQPCRYAVPNYAKENCNPRDQECKDLKAQAKELTKNKGKPGWCINDKKCQNLCDKITIKQSANKCKSY